MAIEVRQTGQGPRYKVRLRRPDGSAYARTFRTEKDARAFERTQQADQIRGVWSDPSAGRTTVGEWATQWRTSRAHLKPKALASLESLLESRVLPRWSATPLGKVRHADVATWVAEMQASGLSASRVRQAYHVLTSMLDAAVADGRLPKNRPLG